MSAFRDQSFANRFLVLGDEAEGVFDSLYPASRPFGLNRPPFNVSKLSLRQRYAPDRQMVDGLVEVMGLGSDQKLKLKIEKVLGLLQWEATDPVSLFVWDRTNRRHTIGPIDLWVDALFRCGEYDQFPDNQRPYIALHTSDFPYPFEDLP